MDLHPTKDVKNSIISSSSIVPLFELYCYYDMCVCTCVYLCVRVCACILMCVRVCMYVCVRVSLHAHEHVCVYVEHITSKYNINLARKIMIWLGFEYGKYISQQAKIKINRFRRLEYQKLDNSSILWGSHHSISSSGINTSIRRHES